MKLVELLQSLGSYQLLSDLADFEVKGITCNSQNVAEGYIFVAIKGTSCDGHKYIDDAIRGGAKAVIVQGSELKVPSHEKACYISVDDTHEALAKLAAKFFGCPSEKIKVIGITGTNGKTTITYLIEAILKEAGLKPAVIGTINYRFQDKLIPAKNTTPGAGDLQAMLKGMLDNGASHVIMEVSSHALDQERVAGVNFYAGIFTNLTQDHLDYHHNLDNYFQAKARLFISLKPGSLAIINNDDGYAKKLINLTQAKVVTYGIKYNVDVLAKGITFDAMHTEFILEAGLKELGFSVHLIGRHNVYNILAAIAFAIHEGIDFTTIKSALEKFTFVPGRLEKVENKKNISVLIDYAHTEDALRNVISTLREVSRNKIIVVFGCGGERDKAKRPKMGEAVTELADYALITNDNPRSEDPQQIISDIKSGIKKNNYCVIPDRREAIKKALALAKSQDIVLIAGKGHEDYQILKNNRIPFNDRKVAFECLK
ncbi:MAG: UDP-N-acetylmuramoyl-L-alanyl-D-glutamate--2,6-diaminopimelate ligase [Candidatus Omnitrophica bacterium]|jgi:UDP-N-acetylmuramoyl-L-alanyl-D-glutamate--2,6-diaminopimelate ligase|nr:UDP-N-acetylmuramoyl-L-alanyl-D-glutamate--2,6-diaminopimelate ligase [Candidatus Omnitrophota bacterium]